MINNIALTYARAILLCELQDMLSYRSIVDNRYTCEYLGLQNTVKLLTSAHGTDSNMAKGLRIAAHRNSPK